MGIRSGIALVRAFISLRLGVSKLDACCKEKNMTSRNARNCKFFSLTEACAPLPLLSATGIIAGAFSINQSVY